MFCIEMAGIPIGIDNRYEYIERLCRGYEIEGKAPAFTVSATEEELQRRRMRRGRTAVDIWKASASTARSASGWPNTRRS